MTETATRWNLDPLYTGPDDPAIEEDLREAAERAETFRQDYRAVLKTETPGPDLLCRALDDYRAIQRLGLKPCFYVHLLFARDSTRQDARKAMGRVREQWNAISETALFFELELLRLDEGAFSSLAGHSDLAEYAHYLHKLRAQSAYALEESVEQALLRKDLSGKDAFTQLFEELTSSLLFTFHMPQEERPREVTGEELLGLLHHHDADVRRRALGTFLDKHGENALVLTSCFNNILLDHGKESELRGYPDLMTPSLLENETDRRMVDSLMTVTEENYGLARDYFGLKARLLGIGKLKNTDIYAPVGLQTGNMSFTEARELVLDAFTGFSAQMAQLAQKFFDEERIDAFPEAGKTGGAFCMGMMPGLSPYVLLNYTGTMRDVSTLAHELGHGVHFSLSQGQNLFHYDASLPMAETASVFGEMLLTRRLLENHSDRRVKIALLCGRIEDIIATTFRQNVLTRFEQEAHRRRGEELLSSDELCELWLEENGKLFGGSVETIEPYRWGWSYIGHFIHSRFYCYSYIFGELLVLALYQRYLEEGDSFVPRYLDLLKAGGSKAPRDLVAPFGIDLHDRSFWQKGYDLVRELYQELYVLVESEGF